MKQKRSFQVVLVISSLLSVLSRNLSGQFVGTPAPTAGGDAKKSIVVEVELVNVVFSAVDKKGKVVTDLTREDIKIEENDKEQTITNFTRESDVPLAIALLIDTSTSIRDKLKVEQEAAIDFFHTTIRRRLDKATLLSFDSTIDLLQPFTDNPDELTKAVRKLKPGGGTKMFDAIQLACQEQLKKESGKRRVAGSHQRRRRQYELRDAGLHARSCATSRCFDLCDQYQHQWLFRHGFTEERQDVEAIG